jgi:uncharacterized protein DUF202
MTAETGGAGGRDERPGLQAERTRLSWERAALAAVVNGALLLLRHGRGWPVVAPAAFGLALALTLTVVGLRRGRRIARDPHPGPARRPVLVSGGATAVFGITVFALLAVTSTPP